MARAIMNRKSTSDDHKHKIISTFIPAAMRATKLVGSQTAMDIRRALDSKQYSSALTSLSQSAKGIDDRQYLPSHISENPLDTIKSQACSFDKILKIRLAELSSASSIYIATLIKEF